MSFRFCCPKCNSQHVTIDTDRQASYREQANHFLKCTICAWVLYGDDRIEEEVSRQRRSWRKQQEEEERVRTVEAERNAEEERRMAEEEMRRLAIKCQWPTCNRPHRPNSKYCSCDCSNKNARARYKNRRGDDTDIEAV